MTVHALYGRSDVRSTTCPSLASQTFPTNAHAVICRPARSPMTSGKARSRGWKLRFERRTPPVIEPLMGWAGGDDTLVQVELSFPSLDSAVAYARRQGLNYTVQDGAACKPDIRVIARATDAERASAIARRRCRERIEQVLGPDVMRCSLPPGADPAGRYGAPREVLYDHSLTTDQKRKMLQRWALDAYRLDLAFSRDAPEDSRLQEVIDALTKLERARDTSGFANRSKASRPAA